ncbi:hypothetical protein BBK82_03100 [Lentzea guizhouensis]|uniref:Uncharacterized protein n=1 Tax=Lentzea guizhouensis TaxID=1586287 RepID=A0A1B2HBV0_9PSEU|nr:hypothetical protein [Lentzea guizhouensis]ANZ35205.1 hypothetical protein BBK82_03100 [Lentzea guizhouensis]
MKHPPVETDATRRAEQNGRILLTQLLREGRTNTEIARLLRMSRGHLVAPLNELRRELIELGAPGVRPVDLDSLQGACDRSRTAR